MRSTLVRGLFTLVGVALGAMTVPSAVCGLGANAAFDLARDEQLERARGLQSLLSEGVDASRFSTGSARFDGEWAFGTHSMATLGLGQLALAHPAERASMVAAMERSVARLVSDETNAFGTEAWGQPGLRHLAQGVGHGYLGYANLALSMLRLIDERTPHAALGDSLTNALAERLERSPHGLFETYPGETYPPDMAMVAASVALHDCAAGVPERAFMPGFRAQFRRYVDESSGLLYQVADQQSGAPWGPPRGSGTALAAYALSFVDAQLSRELLGALRRHSLNVLGFGMVREYPPGYEGSGDIDSGPVLFGLGVSATGFSLAAARLHGDRELFTRLYRTVDLVGVPVRDAEGRHFVGGGPLGNAIVLAMTSASFEWSKHCRKGRS